jgi:hypothetical protein
MLAQSIVGVIVVSVGVLVILFSRQIPKLLHAGLRVFYGEPVADDAVRSRSMRTHVITVGAVFIIFGVLMIAMSVDLL